MKFAVLQCFSWPGRRVPLPTVYERAMQRIEIMDKTGYDAVWLAEEVALLDMLTGGRVNWGAGRGFDPSEFKAFGVPVEDSYARFQEAVEIVLAAWTNEYLNWQGDYWHFDEIEVLPSPCNSRTRPLGWPYRHRTRCGGRVRRACRL